jgi:hypothetical protein
MTKKIGHDYSRDPYPWDKSQKLAKSAKWECCNLSVPDSYLICPICEKEREQVSE